MKRFGLRAIILPGIIAILAANMYAVDGVILIDQNKAMAGGVSPGDTPGFPVSITQPGSYKLTANLIVPSGVNGIEISASNVTVDLNGFMISGPADTCVNLFMCSPSYGIRVITAAQAITIRNGTISGFASRIDFGFNTRNLVEDLILLNVPGGNISASTEIGSYSVVRRVISDSAVDLHCPLVAVESVANPLSAVTGGAGSCILSSNLGVVF
jgi:hypothetical protein